MSKLDMEARDANGRTLAEFLAAYDPGRYPRPSLTADIVIFRIHDDDRDIVHVCPLDQSGGNSLALDLLLHDDECIGHLEVDQVENCDFAACHGLIPVQIGRDVVNPQTAPILPQMLVELFDKAGIFGIMQP